MTEPDNSILCTCGRPWHAVIPPPPCQIHDVPIAVDTGYFSTWEMPPPTTTTKTPAPDRDAGCDMQDVPFCGWGDALPPSLLESFLGPLTTEQIEALSFDGIDERSSMVTFYGVSGARALDVLDAADDLIERWPWLLGYPVDRSLGRLAAAVDAWRKAVAAERASTEEDDRG